MAEHPTAEKVTAQQRFKLRQFIKDLEGKRGRHTELVTVYVPAGYDLNKIIQHLSQEQGTATNIKSAQTRNNVITALEKLIQHLRLYPKTPPHGLAAFSGNVAEREGQQDFQVWSIEPPLAIKQRIYRCDKTFQLDILRDMCEEKALYGLVVLDRRDAAIAYLKGKTIIPLKKTHSEVPGKFRAGGQSAPRFARLREGAIKDHFKKIAEYMKEEFLGNKDLKGIIIGGPGVTVNDFLNKDYLTGDLKKLIIGTKDLSYTGDFGLNELLDKSQDLLAEEEIAEEKKLMQRFFKELSKDSGLASYGKDEVRRHLNMGAVDILLLSEALDDEEAKAFEEEAEKLGTNVQIISTESREGAQLKEIGGVAAILRYAAM
ncbi:peptide chain release factor 1 [Candidatus Woesearchaeota archaeon]|nr:MAG: peptide chain release factor 1 [Candidatus Woesearchaeota archaeon]